MSSIYSNTCISKVKWCACTYVEGSIPRLADDALGELKAGVPCTAINNNETLDVTFPERAVTNHSRHEDQRRAYDDVTAGEISFRATVIKRISCNLVNEELALILCLFIILNRRSSLFPFSLVCTGCPRFNYRQEYYFYIYKEFVWKE